MTKETRLQRSLHEHLLQSINDNIHYNNVPYLTLAEPVEYDDIYRITAVEYNFYENRLEYHQEEEGQDEGDTQYLHHLKVETLTAILEQITKQAGKVVASGEGTIVSKVAMPRDFKLLTDKEIEEIEAFHNFI